MDLSPGRSPDDYNLNANLLHLLFMEEKHFFQWEDPADNLFDITPAPDKILNERPGACVEDPVHYLPGLKSGVDKRAVGAP